MRFAGKVLNIDPFITDIIGTAAATLVSVGLHGVWVPVFDAGGKQIASTLLTGLEAIGRAMGTTVLPTLASEFAFYGIIKLGEMIGIDSNIANAIGIGLRSMLRVGIKGTVLFN